MQLNILCNLRKLPFILICFCFSNTGLETDCVTLRVASPSVRFRYARCMEVSKLPLGIVPEYYWISWNLQHIFWDCLSSVGPSFAFGELFTCCCSGTADVTLHKPIYLLNGHNNIKVNCLKAKLMIVIKQAFLPELPII